MKRLNVPTEFKAAGETGSFSGYASIFGNVDLGGDICERGCFKEIVTNAQGKVVTLWQHSTNSPIGVSSVKQDEKGLAFEGQLVMEDPKARVALAHMKAGSVCGMSFGYDVLPGGAEIKESGVRVLKALKLWEISPVTFGMNPLAQVESAKAVDQICTIRDFEDFLRDAGGFSHAKAKLLASRGWAGLQGSRDAGNESAIKQLNDALRGFVSAPLKSIQE